MSDRTIVKNQFGGGMRSKDFSMFEPGESAELINFRHIMGDLRLTEGAVPLAPDGFRDQYYDGLGTYDSKRPVTSLIQYRSQDKVYLIAKCGAALWIGIPYTLVANVTAIGATSIILYSDPVTLPHAGYILFRNNLIEYTAINHSTNTLTLAFALTVAIPEASTITGYEWRPLCANACVDGTTKYLNGGYNSSNSYASYVPEQASIQQVGSYVYFSFNDIEEYAATPFDLMRWDGFVVYKGRVKCTGNTTVSAETGAGRWPIAWNGDSDANGKWEYLPGDVIYFKLKVGLNVYRWPIGQSVAYQSDQNYTTGRTIASVSSSSLTLTYNGIDTTGRGADGTDYVDYVIVRVHKAGVAAGTTCTATGAAPVSCTNGYFKYKWRYKNSHTGFTGNFSEESAVVHVDGVTYGGVFVSGWDTTPADLDCDQVEIFRSGSDDNIAFGPWHHPRNGATTDWTGIIAVSTASFGDASTSTSPDTGAPESDADYHDRPPALGALFYFNDKLHGRETGATVHYARFSTQGKWEYFPSIEIGAPDPGLYNDWMGGRIPLGMHPGEAIMSFVPESGMYAAIGAVGEGLLVLLRNRSTRLYGSSWSDLRLMDGFGDGCVAEHSVCVGDGYIYWVGERGPLRLAYGSNSPQPFAPGMWPDGMREMIVQVGTDTLKWCGTYWNGYYCLSGIRGTGTVNDCVFLYHVASGTWFVDDTPAYALAALVDGNLIAGRSDAGAVDQMFTQISNVGPRRPGYALGLHFDPVTGSYLSDPIWLTSKAEELGHPKHIERVVACFKAASTAQTVRLRVYKNGNLTTPCWPVAPETGQVTLAADADAEVALAKWTPKFDGLYCQIAIDGDFTDDMRLLWYSSDPKVHAGLN